MSDLVEATFVVVISVGATTKVALGKHIVKRWREFLHLQKRLGVRSAFLFVQDSLGASLNPRVE